LRKSADEHFFSGSGPEILRAHSYGHGWVIPVRRTQEREDAALKEVVKVKRAGVALTVLRGFLRSLVCPGNFTPPGRSHTATVRIF